MSVIPQSERRTSQRKSRYTFELGQQVCEGIAGGATLQRACDTVSVNPNTFIWWCHQHDELAVEYARARQRQNEAIDDELRSLADQVTPENARAIETKFRMLTWIAGKRAPKAFGDRVGIEHSGKDGGPLRVQVEVVGDSDD
jgi:hypothetical protein